MTDTPKHAACPFCRSHDVGATHDTVGGHHDEAMEEFAVECSNCGARGPWSAASYERAWKLWDDR